MVDGEWLWGVGCAIAHQDLAGVIGWIAPVEIYHKQNLGFGSSKIRDNIDYLR